MEKNIGQTPANADSRRGFLKRTAATALAAGAGPAFIVPGRAQQALGLYYERDFDGAQAKLFGVLKQNPKDKVAWHHLVQATNALEKGVSDSWSGVTAMDRK